MSKNARIILVLVLIAVTLAAILYFYRRSKDPEIEPPPPPVSGKLLIRFLDIGQGDAELIQLPTGETILIDSGDSSAPTVELLRRYGVKQIDLAIGTHPHADHIGEMVEIMRAFNVKEFWDVGLNTGRPTYRRMLEEILARNIVFTMPRRGDTRKIGDALIEVLNPGPQLNENPNNTSIVVRLTYGGKRFLFTGDAEIDKSARVSSAWEEMLQMGADRLRADLLKAAHHGSHNGTTAAILDAVRPSVVTISCKMGNDYGHPHREVVQLLGERRNSIALYRTDLHGTITATSDGNTIELSAEKQAAEVSLYRSGNELAPGMASDGRKRDRVMAAD
jgi:competence protein ComEC